MASAILQFRAHVSRLTATCLHNVLVSNKPSHLIFMLEKLLLGLFLVSSHVAVKTIRKKNGGGKGCHVGEKAVMWEISSEGNLGLFCLHPDDWSVLAR